MQVSQLLLSASQQLNKLSDSPRLDAEVLLAHCLKKNRTWLVTWLDKELSENEISQFNQLLQRRKAGEPIAHITEQREFWSLPLSISPDTLIPRPDTELMVEQILAHYPADTSLTLADLGTGSGAIALALASERAIWKIIATDQSAAALDIARKNAGQLAPENLNLDNIEFRQGNWFEPLSDIRFDIIASNPPYIPEQDPHLNQGDVRFEPISALASGQDGLDDIRYICKQARQHLKHKGMLIIEHGFDQKSEIREIFTINGYDNITQVHDLAQNPRLTFGFNSD